MLKVIKCVSFLFFNYIFSIYFNLNSLNNHNKLKFNINIFVSQQQKQPFELLLRIYKLTKINIK